MLVCTTFFMSTFTINLKVFAFFWMSFEAFIFSAIRLIFTNLIVMISLAIFSKLAKPILVVFANVFFAELFRHAVLTLWFLNLEDITLDPPGVLLFPDLLPGPRSHPGSLSLCPSRSCFLLYLLVQLISSRLGALSLWPVSSVHWTAFNKQQFH